MRILIELGRMEDNMNKFQERLSLILLSTTIIFSFALIGFGVFFVQTQGRSAVAVCSGLFLFAISMIYITDLLGIKK